MSVGVFWDASGALHKCIVALLLLWFSVAVALPLLRRACAFPVLAHTGLRDLLSANHSRVTPLK